MAEPVGIGGLLKGFTEGFDDQMKLGAIFEKNKVLREKFEQTKKTQKSIDARLYMKRGTDYLESGTKSYKDHFELGKELFPDFKRQMDLLLQHNDKALLNFNKHRSFLLRQGVPQDTIDQTFETKGMDGILQLLDQEHKKEEKNKSLELAGAPVPSQRIREETLPSMGEGTFAERSLGARRKILKELTLERNRIGTEGAAGKLIQTRVEQAERALTRAESAVEKLKTGRAKISVTEQARADFVAGKENARQRQLLKIDSQPDRLKIIEQARKNVNLSLPKGILGSVTLQSFGKDPEARMRRMTEMIQAEADRLEKELKRVGDRPGKPPSIVGQGVLLLEEAFASKQVSSVPAAKDLLRQTGQLNEEQINQIIDAFQSE